MTAAQSTAELDAGDVLSSVEASQAELVAAEARRFELAVLWVQLHAGEALEDERRRTRRRVLPGMERALPAGADGTPLVAEFAASEFGAVAGMSPAGAAGFQTDAVNVYYRHPLLWRSVMTGAGRVWQAQQVARMCASAGLSSAQAEFVDAATTPYLGSLPWLRFRALVEAKIIEADPAAAEERARAAAMSRFVRTGQSNEYGLKTIIARAEAGDVIFFTAMVDRIAQILAENGDTDPVDVRRSKSVGILANPARALLMLQEASRDDIRAEAGDADRGDAEADPAGGDTASDEDPSESFAPCPECDGSGLAGDPAPFRRRLPSGPVIDLGKVDPKQLLPDATLYLHLHQRSLSRGGGVARMEGVGPLVLEQVRAFLHHTNVTVVPVLDVAGQAPVDGYEAPARIREALHLRGPACGFPWATHLGRRKDADHVTGYVPPDDGGPPGQTSMGNLAWLARFSHRLKTHGRWRLRQAAPGVLEWRSPHGYWWRVDHTGTHPLGRESEPGHPPDPVEGDSAVPVRRAVTDAGTSPLEVDFAELLTWHRDA
jgi:hypothetical protein